MKRTIWMGIGSFVTAGVFAEPGDEKVEGDAAQEFAGLGDGGGDRGPGVRERLAGVRATEEPELEAHLQPPSQRAAGSVAATVSACASTDPNRVSRTQARLR